MDNINVSNLLEVKLGGVIQVPGCEPVSSITSAGLLRNLHCNSAVISVKKALEVIPGSKLVRLPGPMGTQASNLFFMLPSGPPPDGNTCPRNCFEDFYEILRQNSTVEEPEEKPICAGFDFGGCVTKQPDIRMTARDPNMRPNSEPLQPVLRQF